MKIKVKSLDYDKVKSLPRPKHKKPKKPTLFFRTLLKACSMGDLRKAQFTYSLVGMDALPDRPCLILMNHSSFIDLEIISNVFYPRPFSIVCTSDGFVGKEWLMRALGCIPTGKFITDVGLIADIKTALYENNADVLMYPEASYSFDGTATALPRGLGLLLKRLAVPVLMVRTYGAFTRDPLYNGLQKRNVPVSCEISELFSIEEIAELPREILDKRLDEVFGFDHFAWQKENEIRVTEPFRADGLERILYKCRVCEREGTTEGRGVTFMCKACGTSWEMNELGELENKENKGFSHIPDWYAWERQAVQQEISEGRYLMDADVKILMMVDYKAIYDVGSGHLRHDKDGFHLDGCGGRLHFERGPADNYGLYADYYWYERGDMIAIGDRDAVYYCFPEKGVPVAKARLATEELYKANKTARKAAVRAE